MSQLSYAAFTIVGGLHVALFATVQQQPPRFRTGVDLTRIEVTVLDAETRKPIPDLEAGDFEIKVDGVIQRVASLARVVVPGASSNASDNGLAESARDVTNNSAREPRLTAILMNDASGSNDPFNRKTGLEIAHRIIDSLGPQDKAAVIFTRDNRYAQDFTDDRVLLRRAVERFNPMQTVGIGPFGVLQRLQRFLVETPGFRRAVVFISPVPLGSSAVTGRLSVFGVNEEAAATAREIQAISTAARVAHVPIYSFSTHGLHAPTAADLRLRQGRNFDHENFTQRLWTIAGLTGGRAVMDHNTPAQVVPSMFDELSSYYALAYENSYSLDGRRRWLDVKVRRPGVLVMPSRVLITAEPPQVVAENAKLATTRDSGLIEALSAPLPVGDLPLQLSAVQFARPAQPKHALMLTLGLPLASSAQPVDYLVQILTYDGEGRRQIASETHGLRVTPPSQSDRAQEVVFRVDLKPGRYQLRVAAENKSTKTAGSVHATVIIPDFEKEPLTLSGVAIGWAGRGATGGRDAVTDFISFAPTTGRTFGTSDTVGALIRVHQRLPPGSDAVLVECEILDTIGNRVSLDTRRISPSEFTPAGVEHRFELPLSRLKTGDYVLRFVASISSHRQQRDVRFTVK